MNQARLNNFFLGRIFETALSFVISSWLPIFPKGGTWSWTAAGGWVCWDAGVMNIKKLRKKTLLSCRFLLVPRVWKLWFRSQQDLAKAAAETERTERSRKREEEEARIVRAVMICPILLFWGVKRRGAFVIRFAFWPVSLTPVSCGSFRSWCLFIQFEIAHPGKNQSSYRSWAAKRKGGGNKLNVCWKDVWDISGYRPLSMWLLQPAVSGKDKGWSPKKKGKGGRGVKSIGFAWICSIDMHWWCALGSEMKCM